MSTDGYGQVMQEGLLHMWMWVHAGKREDNEIQSDLVHSHMKYDKADVEKMLTQLIM